MRFLSRTLAMILSLQLAVSCGDGFSIKALSQSDTVSIRGTIAKAFDVLSNAVLPSAMAKEGLLELYQVDDKGELQFIDSQKISGTNKYEFKIPAEEAAGAIYQIKFAPDDKDEEVRQLYVSVADSVVAGAKVESNLDADSSVAAIMLEAQIKQEIVEKKIDQSEMKNRISDLNGSVAILSSVNILGESNAAAVKSMLLDREYQENAMNIVGKALVNTLVTLAPKASVDAEVRTNSLGELQSFASKVGLIASSAPIISCVNGQISFVNGLKSEMDYNVTVDGISDSALYESGELGSTLSFRDAAGAIEVTKKIQEILQKYHDKSGVAVYASIYVQDAAQAMLEKIAKAVAPAAACIIYSNGKIDEIASDIDEEEPVEEAGPAAPGAGEIDLRILYKIDLSGVRSTEEAQILLEKALPLAIDDLVIRIKSTKGMDSETADKLYTAGKDAGYAYMKELLLAVDSRLSSVKR